MIIDTNGRQTGKTTRAINFLKNNNDYCFLCQNENEKIRLHSIYPEVKNRIITISEIGRIYSSSINKLIIDDIECHRIEELSKIKYDFHFGYMISNENINIVIGILKEY